MKLAHRVKTLTPSPTLAITAKAKTMKQKGYDIISLGAGGPDFNTPSYILDAAETAMREGMTKYTPSGGILELKSAIANKLKEDYSHEYTTDEIVVTGGTNLSVYTVVLVVVYEGDVVIEPGQDAFSYRDQLKIAGGNAVIVDRRELYHSEL